MYMFLKLLQDDIIKDVNKNDNTGLVSLMKNAKKRKEDRLTAKKALELLEQPCMMFLQ
jgi:hypothetical protein